MCKIIHVSDLQAAVSDDRFSLDYCDDWQRFDPVDVDPMADGGLLGDLADFIFDNAA